MQQNVADLNSFKGYSLFKEPECKVFKHRNRGAIMANIIEDNMKNELITAKGTATLLGYFKHIPASERKLALEACNSQLKQRGVNYEAH